MGTSVEEAKKNTKALRRGGGAGISVGGKGGWKAAMEAKAKEKAAGSAPTPTTTQADEPGTVSGRPPETSNEASG